MNRVLRFIIAPALAFLALSSATGAASPDDVIARVGDQFITLTEIDRMIDSSSMVGIGLPPRGSPARNALRLNLLDKAISANLLYLDAMNKEVGNNPVFERDVRRYSETMLASLYRKKHLIGEMPVSDDEVRDFYKESIAPNTPFTKDLRLAIESSLRKAKFKDRTDTLRERLRKGVDIAVHEEYLNPAGDAERKAGTAVVTINGKSLTWGEVQPLLLAGGGQNDLRERLAALDQLVDHRIMVQKGKAAGLEQDPAYRARVHEFRKVRLINIHRANLVDAMEPDDEELRNYFKKNRDRISIPAARKVQMVVLKTEEEAKEVKQKIESGKLTIFEAALEYSIDPNADQTLGEIGWVNQGSGFPDLDRLTFLLPEGKLGGPVQSPAGWHLVKVLERRDAQFDDIDDRDTRRKTRRMLIRERRDDYVIGLRKNTFRVEVYEDVINRLFREEAAKLQAAAPTGELAQPSAAD